LARDILFLNLINDCNLACNYCIVPGKNTQKMSRKTMLANLKYFLGAGRGLLHVDFFNCESMLRFDLIKEAIKYCESHVREDQSLSLSIITNGTLFDEEKLDFFKSHPDICLTISLDGTEESHDRHRKYRNGKGSFKDVIRHIGVLKDMNTLFSIIISPETAGKLIENVRFLYDSGCKKLILQFVLLRDGWSREKIDIVRGQLKELVRFYLYASGGRYDFEIFLIDFMIKTLEKRKNIDVPSSFERLICSTINKKRAMSVNPSGDIYPCWGFSSLADDNFLIGRSDTGIDPDAEHHFYKEVLPEFAEKSSASGCSDCEIRDFCYLRGCPLMRPTGLFNKALFREMKGLSAICALHQALFNEVKQAYRQSGTKPEKISQPVAGG